MTDPEEAPRAIPVALRDSTDPAFLALFYEFISHAIRNVSLRRRLIET
jgi:hypothetical protein